MEPIRVNVGGQPVLVVQPEAAAPGPLSVDLLATFNGARASGAAACVLPPPDVADAALLALVPEDVPLVSPRGAAGAWLRARWWGAVAARRTTSALGHASSSFWLESYRELRRQAGDVRLPSDLRARLREHAQGSLARSSAAHEATRFPRRLLRERVHATLPPALLAEAAGAAAAIGIPRNRPLVALESRSRPDTFARASAWLLEQGYCVVRIGDALDPIGQPDVIDLALSPHRTPVLELFVLLTARFVVCESVDLQHVAYLTNTPSLLINARDPFRAYPVREDSLFTLSTPIDLDTGEALAPADLLQERYFRNFRNFGFRGNAAEHVLAAVREIHDGVMQGWREDERQARFRELVTSAGAALGSRIASVGMWGPDAGFIGHGRLAAWQANTLSARAS